MSFDVALSILDPIHGSISITEEEKRFIDQPLVQRLRHVKQLGFLHYIFPSANHTRFEHSLGAMHLAGELFKSLVNNQIEVLKDAKQFPALVKTKPIVEHIEKHYNALHKRVRLAALLHDVGHGPFSHVSERLLQKIPVESFLNLKPTLPSWLTKVLLGLRPKSMRHEVLGYVVASQMFQRMGHDDSEARDVLSILNPAIAPASGSPLCFGLQGLLGNLIAGEADCDRMDYLLRDAAFTGVKYGVFDLNRILKSLLFTLSPKGKPQITFRKSGALAFEYYAFCRNHMHQQIYRHKTNLAFNAMLETLLSKVRQPIPTQLDEFVGFHDLTFPSWLRRHLPESPLCKALHRDLFGADESPQRTPWKHLCSTYKRADFVRAKRWLKARQDGTAATTIFHEKRMPPRVLGVPRATLLSKNAFGDRYEIVPSSRRTGPRLYQIYLSPVATGSEREGLIKALKTVLR